MEILGTVGIVALFIFGALIALGMILAFLGFIVEEGNGGACSDSRPAASNDNQFSVSLPEGGQCKGYIEFYDGGVLPDYIRRSYADHSKQMIEHKR